MNARFPILAVVILGLLTVDLHSAPAPAPIEKKDPEKAVVHYGLKNTKWREVFEWLAEMTGKPVLALSYPTGTFTLEGPADREYTISEVIDLVSEELMSDPHPRKYFLLQRERSFVLVLVDKKIDMGLMALRIRPEELEKHGNAEPVSMVFPLKSLNAEQIAPYLTKMKGPFGEVVPMTHSGVNQLIVFDSVRNLKQIREKIEELEHTN